MSKIDNEGISGLLTAAKAYFHREKALKQQRVFNAQAKLGNFVWKYSARTAIYCNFRVNEEKSRKHSQAKLLADLVKYLISLQNQPSHRVFLKTPVRGILAGRSDIYSQIVPSHSK